MNLSPQETITINCQINGKNQQFTVSPALSLMELLRNEGFTSVKQGCGVGECGACTVLIDGIATDSCLCLAVWVDGKEIRTVEGESKNGKLSAMQQAYVNAGAVQCGFCTPGLIMASSALVAKHLNRPLSHDEIRKGLAGNLCRCTGYQLIVKAVDDYQKQRNNEEC